ncbi:MAG: agmatine deiminase family protein [Burkholderiales bacterium]|nr:agmatine deiminase family protein [Burkholderiales bacterium]
MTNTRRQFLANSARAGTAVLATAWLYGCGGGDANAESGQGAQAGAGTASGGATAGSEMAWRMPDEADPHSATWMAFTVSEAIWGKRLQGPVRDALARIANAIVEFEPVNLLVSQQDLALARQKCDPRINFLVQTSNDLWMRDTGAVFVLGAHGAKAAVGFNFNGWGNKQSYALDRQVAGWMARQAGVPLLDTRLTLEGGGLEVDGQGTAIVTESCVLNPNRNPGWSKADCEKELARLLGIQKVIWLPGRAGADITDGHTDFYARFARPGVVVAHLDSDPASPEYALTRRHLDILRNSRDARQRTLQVSTLAAPGYVRPEFDNKDFAAGYVNFYVCNGAVLLPEFGDAQADQAARASLAELFPGRRILQLNIDPIAAGGGGIHCTTQQEPRPTP